MKRGCILPPCSKAIKVVKKGAGPEEVKCPKTKNPPD
jgi:hypothetical protein